MVNKELQLESCPCYDCSTIEGESELSASREHGTHTGAIQGYLVYCRYLSYSTLHTNRIFTHHLHLHTGAVMRDLAVDQHSTWMDLSTQPPIQRFHSDHQDTIQDATSDNLHHFCTVSECFYTC